mmetsp:Transcript_17774/g.27650  ORF Transcript_17774/g.27650 Transcript_17774/m.27650 type:complete len:104 (+) Transcript_17774:1414-1725(+)
MCARTAFKIQNSTKFYALRAPLHARFTISTTIAPAKPSAFVHHQEIDPKTSTTIDKDNVHPPLVQLSFAFFLYCANTPQREIFFFCEHHIESDQRTSRAVPPS